MFTFSNEDMFMEVILRNWAPEAGAEGRHICSPCLGM